MLSEHPLLVIGLPVYNESKFIAQTIQSLKDQTHKDFKVLVSDNCSTDNSWEIIEKSTAGDSRFVCIRQEKNLGSAENFNFLLKNSASPLFMWLGAHDLIAENYLKIISEILLTNKDLALAYSRVNWIDHSGNVIKTTDGGNFIYPQDDGLSRFLNCIKGPWGECTAVNNVFRRSAICKVGFEPYASCDHLILACAQFHGKFHRHGESLYFRRDFKNTKAEYLAKILGNTSNAGEASASRLSVIKWKLSIAYIREYFALPVFILKKVIYFPKLLYFILIGNRLLRSIGSYCLLMLNLKRGC